MEHVRGCNIVALVPCQSLETKGYELNALWLARRKVLGALHFSGAATTNGKSHSLVYFLQPEIWDRMAF